MVLGIRKPIVRQTEVIIETESGTKTIGKRQGQIFTL